MRQEFSVVEETLDNVTYFGFPDPDKKFSFYTDAVSGRLELY